MLVGALTREEKLALTTGYFGVQQPWNEYQLPEARRQSAGVVRGVARVGFPPQWQGDAGSGVAPTPSLPSKPPQKNAFRHPTALFTSSDPCLRMARLPEFDD